MQLLLFLLHSSLRPSTSPCSHPPSRYELPSLIPLLLPSPPLLPRLPFWSSSHSKFSPPITFLLQPSALPLPPPRLGPLPLPPLVPTPSICLSLSPSTPFLCPSHAIFYPLPCPFLYPAFTTSSSLPVPFPAPFLYPALIPLPVRRCGPVAGLIGVTQPCVGEVYAPQAPRKGWG